MEKIGKQKNTWVAGILISLLSCLVYLSIHLIFPNSSHSTITASQYITIDSLCSFEMDNYPFDVQLCKVTLRPKPNSDLFVELWGDDIRYYGPKDLMKYGDIAIQITKSNVCT